MKRRRSQRDCMVSCSGFFPEKTSFWHVVSSCGWNWETVQSLERFYYVQFSESGPSEESSSAREHHLTFPTPSTAQIRSSPSSPLPNIFPTPFLCPKSRFALLTAFSERFHRSARREAAEAAFVYSARGHGRRPAQCADGRADDKPPRRSRSTHARR